MHARHYLTGVHFVRHVAGKLSYTAAPKPPAARAARLARNPDGRVNSATAAFILNTFGQEHPLMDKITLALIIAQNGLTTAAGALTAKANKADAQAAAATGADAAKFKKQADKSRKLAAALTASNTGITAYLADTM